MGATTFDEYRKYIEKDAALERRFQSIAVEPPNEEDTLAILKGLRGRYEQHHKVDITDDALRSAVELSGRYMSNRVQPDKSIDVIDEAGARVRLKTMRKPPDLADLEAEIEKLSVAKDEAVRNADYEKAAEIRDQAEALRKQKEDAQTQWREQLQDSAGTVDADVIAEVISKMTGVPLTRLSQGEAERLLKLEDELQCLVHSHFLLERFE